MKKLHGFIKALPIKIACTCFFSAWAFSNGYSQDLPKIILPSPEAAALFRFQDYPIDHSTGVPQINIPLYEVKSGSLSVPINISYHASGRKVSDLDGPISLGWSLNAGGSVSRTVYGSVDFGTYPFPSPLLLNINNSSDLAYLEQINHFDKNNPPVNPGNWKDSEYDIFSYYFGGSSGKFFFKDNGGVKTPALLPYKPYVITPVYTQSGGLTEIDILDDKGVSYKFVGNGYYNSSYGNVYTEFTLMQIVSADKTDIISFVYEGFIQNRTSISQSETLMDKQSFPAAQMLTQPPPYNVEQTNQDKYQISRLTEIHFKQGKVIFNLVSGSDKVDNIQIFDNNNVIIKSIQLNRSFLDSSPETGNNTYKLDGLVFKDKLGNVVENYAFDYYPDYFPGNNTNGFNVRYRDWWGYYNASGQTEMVPYYQNLEYIDGGPLATYTLGNPSYNRDPYLPGLESGVLKKITYPTGGSSEFIYEHNKYMSNSTLTVKNGPGLRIQQIKTNDNNGTTSYKTYTYGNNELGYGVLDMEPDITNMAVESYYGFIPSNTDPENGSYRQRVFLSDFIPELSAIGDRPVTYPTITEYHGTTASNTGKTVFTYDYAGWAPSGIQTNTNLTIYRKHIANYNYWNNASLITQTDYKNTDGNYQARKQVVNGYNTTTTEYVSGLHVERIYNYPQAGYVTCDPNGNPPLPCAPVELFREPYAVQYYPQTWYPYGYGQYQIPIGYKNLLSTVETLYNDDGSTVSNTISNVYNANQFISQTNRTGSDNIALSTQIKYPADYTGNAVLTQMVGPTLNMLNYPVEQNEFKNGLPVKGVRTNYYNWGSTTPMIAPQTVDVKTSANAYETRLRYYGYDGNGNPLSVSKENGALISYIWDYQNTYPIAEVKNAAKTEIAYTSFEADGTGNWAGINTANIATTANSITGTKYYNFSGTTLSKAGLTSSTVYTISYWSKNGAYTVSGTPVSGWPKSIRTVNINGASWTNWEHRVSGASTITVSGTGAIDELRLYPSNAQMTSYTFAPLIGMTSQNSAANGINYFEYDANGRLKLVRDINNNIVKTFNYKYQSATP